MLNQTFLTPDYLDFADFGMLFLLSTGDDKDLRAVRDWVHSLKDKGQNG